VDESLPRNADDLSTEATIDLRDFLALIARRKWLVLTVAAIATGLAILYSYSRTPVYTSQAEVLVRPILSNPLEPSSPDRISLPTEVRIATSAPVASIARDLLESKESIQVLLDRVSVAAPEETQVLEFSYSHGRAIEAQRGAQAFADAYLRFKTEEAVASISRHISTLQTEINTLNEEINILNDQIAAATPDTAEWQDLIDRRSALETTRLAIQTQLATVSILNVDPGQVIQPAVVPLSPRLPNHRLDIVLGALIGLVGGIGLAAASERFRERVEDQASLSTILNAPVLGVIPKASAGQRSGLPATYEQPRSIAAESYRTLRTNVLATSSRPPAKTLLVTSAWMGEGKSTIAANLATALAQVGKDVILISADIRVPRAHTLFGLENGRGLVQVLTGEATLDETLCPTPIEHLRLLPSGPVNTISDPVELIQSDAMASVIERCEEADFVIVDGAPILPVADSLVLAGMVDGVLFVADSRRGRPAAIAQARDQLGQVRARVIGGVLNRVELGMGPRRGYGAHDYRRGLRYRPAVADLEGNGSSTPQPRELRQRRSG
jgi:capsular exopolysaccharide synthesis family protein